MADDQDLVAELGDIFGDTPEEEKAAPAVADTKGTEPETGGDDANSAKPATDEGVKEESAEQTTKQSVFDERLLLDAEQMGVPREFAMQFSTPQDLERHLWVMSRMQPVANATEQPMTQQEKDEFAEALEAIEKDADSYDPALVKLAKGLAVKNQRLEQAMLATMSAEARRVQEAQAVGEREATERWDKLFNDSEMPELFGTGNYFGDKSQITDAQMANRHLVAAQAKKMAEAYADLGRKVPDASDLLMRAVRAEFGDVIQKKEQQTLAKQLSNRESQLSVRPRTSKASAGKSAKESFHEVYSRVIGSNGSEEDYLDTIFGK